MMQRLADYVADFLAERGVTDVFSVVGGGAMHLNDAFGHHKKLKVTYNHHEQASAMAAEAYARIDNRIAAVCVTTGPGGTNALTGVAGGWLDSIPMFIVSGQVRYDTTARYTEQFTEGLPLRAVGNQEYDIVKCASQMTKYAVMLEDPEKIRYVMEKAWHLAVTGRPGPVWVDIPVNFQGMMIDPESLPGYDSSEDDALLPPPVSTETVQMVLSELKKAERPVIYAGYGIRLSGGYEVFRRAAEKLGVPVVTYWNAIDLLETEHPLYVGRGGDMGDRAGNWAVQNADLILSVGSRLSTRQTSMNWKTWAREARILMVDIDRAEMKKHILHDVTEIWADAKDFLEKLLSEAGKEEGTVSGRTAWAEKCRAWKREYPVVTEYQKREYDYVNVYAAFDYLSRSLPEHALTAVSNGACCVAGHQVWHLKKGARFANNNAVASMGYGLPAAIGTCLAAGKRETVCLEGDGSIMMNLSELMTIVYHRLPVRIFLINNNGYHSIRITQSNLFAGNFTGIDAGSGVGFPEFRKVAEAFGLPYYSAHTNEEMRRVTDQVLSLPGPVFVELFTDTDQRWEPKSSAKRLPDGSLTSPPLEDLAPYLPREELEKIMFIPLLPED